MSINETIEELFAKSGVVQITIGTTPNKTRFIAVQQLVKTGAAGNMQEIRHQVEGDSFASCLEILKPHITHANELKTLVFLPPKGANGGN